jgi:TonB family protein
MDFLWLQNFLLSVAIHGAMALSISKGLNLDNQGVGGKALDSSGAFLGKSRPNQVHPVKFYTYEAPKAPSRPHKKDLQNLQPGSADGAGTYGISNQRASTFGISASLMRDSVIAPKFTRDALDAGFEGLLVVDLLVDELGRVTKARLINPTGFGIDDEALLAAQMARYKPAQDLGGRPVASSAELRFEFRAH